MNNYNAIINTTGSKLATLGKSILVGIAVGAIVVAYRLCLVYTEQYSRIIYVFVARHWLSIPLLFAGLAAAGCFVGWLVEKNPIISGSGIPQVKGIIMGHFKHNWLHTLLAKFFGGIIAIFAGLSMGREGPSIQLGATVAEGISRKLATTRMEKKIFIASGASAGLAAAFNAPLAGVMFTLEEIFKYFSPLILLSTMAAAVAADFVSKLVFGTATVFRFDLSSPFPLAGYWLLPILGCLVGVSGVFYNQVLLKTLSLYKKAKWLNARTRPVVAFLLAGAVGLLFPQILGSGHAMVDELGLSSSLGFLLLLITAKFLFSMISFGSGSPGGIFFPLLVIGAGLGSIFGKIAIQQFGVDERLFYGFVILAMVGYFTAIVRAPITGIVLVLELTNSFSYLLPLATVSIVAYVIAGLLKSTPIYDSLLEIQLKDHQINLDEGDAGKKITVEVIVQYGAPAENKLVRELKLPRDCLMIAIRRKGREFIPNGETRIHPEDYLVFLANVQDEAKVREKLALVCLCCNQSKIPRPE